MKLTILNRQRRVRFNSGLVRKLACAALPGCLENHRTDQAPLLHLDEVTVAIVDDPAIAALHEQFMSIGGPTDVITFEHGEIVISAETARSNAKQYRQPLERELALYIIHGLLHLAGHDDQTTSDAARMKRIQTRLLKKADG